MKRWVVRGLAAVVALLVVALLVVGVVSTVVAAGAFRSISTHGLTDCRRLELTGSEDVVLDAATGRVFISSQDFRHLDSSPGDIFLYDPSTGAVPLRLPRTGPAVFHPHGMALFRDASGATLFVVNHPTPTSGQVERFEVRDGPSLVHLESVTLPFPSLNEVAAVGPRQFYVTIDAGTKGGTVGRVAETFLRLPLAGVGYFDGRDARWVVEGLRYANGLAVDGDLVFVSETTGRALHSYRRSADGALTRLASASDASGLDNLSFDETGDVWVGAHPNMLAFLSHAKDPANRSPSQVLRARVDRSTGALTLVDAAMDDGVLVSGSSVAQPIANGRIVIGSVFEHALDCARPR